MRSEKPINIILRSTLSLKRFSNAAVKTVPILVQCSPDWRWPLFVVISRTITDSLLFLHAPVYRPPPPPPDPPPLPPRSTPALPGDRWCDILGFVPAGNVSSAWTLQIFRDEIHLWMLPCSPVCPLDHFPWLGHVQGVSVGVLPTELQTLVYDILPPGAAIIDYAIGPEKLFVFRWCSKGSEFLTRQIRLSDSFVTAQVA